MCRRRSFPRSRFQSRLGRIRAELVKDGNEFDATGRSRNGTLRRVSTISPESMGISGGGFTAYWARALPQRKLGRWESQLRNRVFNLVPCEVLFDERATSSAKSLTQC